MESITDLAPEIQKRICDFEDFLGKEGMKRPEGLLKNGGWPVFHNLVFLILHYMALYKYQSKILF